MQLEIGQTARLKQPVIVGNITDIRYNKDSAGLEYFLEYTDAAGESHQRWFTAVELESV